MTLLLSQDSYKSFFQYYVQVGCTDGNSQSLSVNAYKDNTCTTPDSKNGFDDTNLDVSDLQVPFKQCQSCVYFVDKNEDDKEINQHHLKIFWMLLLSNQSGGIKF